VEDIEQELITEFVRIKSEFQDENELEHLDFEETYGLSLTRSQNFNGRNSL